MQGGKWIRVNYGTRGGGECRWFTQELVEYISVNDSPLRWLNTYKEHRIRTELKQAFS